MMKVLKINNDVRKIKIHGQKRETHGQFVDKE